MIKNNDIAVMLMSKYGISKKSSLSFVSAMIDILNEGLQQDRLVKVKGLGTFKMTSVSARESVDVNTGERILLNEREKISYTPDAVIRDIVNKPFSHFETVILNDGVNFSDIEEEHPQPQPLPEKVSESPVVLEEKVIPPSVDLSEKEVIPPSEDVLQDEDMRKEEGTNKFEVLFYITLFLLMLTLSVGGGLGYYVYNRYINVEKTEIAETMKTLEKAKVAKTLEKAEVAKAPEKPNVAESPEKVEVAETPVKVEASEKPALPTIPDQSVYEGDARVRLGAYYIMGVAQTITVQKGQTLVGLSKAYLGPGMECYVEAVNGGVKVVKEGQKLHIPALKSKKSLKKR